MEGYIKLHRKILDNKYWLEPRRKSKFEAWIYLLCRAGYKDKELALGDIDLSLKAGEFVTSQLKLAEELGWNRETVSRYLERLKTDNQIGYRTSNKFTIITICNWATYQNQDKINPATEPTTEPTTNQHQISIKSSTNNKDKKEKNENKDKERFLEFVLLTKEEHKKLVAQFGEVMTKELIEILNNGIGAKDYKYKSHYHAIMAWHKRNCLQQSEKQVKHHELLNENL